MADHHCCSSHCHEESSSTNTDEPTSSSTDLKQISSNDIHKHFTSNENDDINDESKTISQLFDIAWSNQNDLQSPTADTTADDYSSKLLHSIRLLESLEKRLTSLELFSDNEQIDEVSTTNLRYLLLNAFLAWLYQTKRSKPSQRFINVQHACDYYSKFLTMTRNYGLHKFAIPKTPSNEECEKTEQLSNTNVDMMKMAQGRASKIREYKIKSFEIYIYLIYIF
jgi:immunoglobulin-binding protein 1